jgi:hypothetical protein
LSSERTRGAEPKRPKGRSRVTNGTSIFADKGVDKRSLWARRFVDLYHLHCDDLGGLDSLSEAQRSLVRRAVSIEVELEKLENDLARGEQVDMTIYLPSANALRRLLETLGIERKTKTVDASLSDIVREHQIKTASTRSNPFTEAVE